MMILVLMIPMSIILGATFLLAYIYAIKSGQFDDTVTPAHRILIDEKGEDETI